MSTFKVPSKEEVQPEAQGIFDQLQSKLGFVPNLYAFTGKSANTLGAYLTFQNELTKGAFNAKEREAIFLAVSEANGCKYCQSVHTVLGKANGFSEEETIQLRALSHPDKKWSVLTALAAELVTAKGRPSDSLLKEFFALGYDEAALIDLTALVVDKTFANYIHNFSQVPIDFPLAKDLTEVEV
ncbi:carboxymuconolactone decarboxylase family protein [Rapidithrix thailandica]|uniref:Carboxymuconolactone decarboxylase family protein n=1 Tax=Rapidithrix thailandica TaxID=413964 RepID=A0AAW9S5Q7_9BACT